MVCPSPAREGASLFLPDTLQALGDPPICASRNFTPSYSLPGTEVPVTATGQEGSPTLRSFFRAGGLLCESEEPTQVPYFLVLVEKLISVKKISEPIPALHLAL